MNKPETQSGGSLKPVGSAIDDLGIILDKLMAVIPTVPEGVADDLHDAETSIRWAMKSLRPPNVLAQAGRVEEPRQTDRRNPALPGANCSAS